MKKIFTLIILMIIPASKAYSQTNIFFDNLIGNEFRNNVSEFENYRISNKLINNKWTLETKWWGGINFSTKGSIKFNSLWGTVYIAETGNVGINNENPGANLDVSGNFRVVNHSNYFTYDGDGDLKLRFANRGMGGRFIVHDVDDVLVLNYDNDFRGGTKIGHSAFFHTNGNVGIGSLNPDSKLTVKGNIHAEEIKVDLAVPADYVFQKYYTGKSTLKPEYTLKTIEEIEEFTKSNHHLPNIPSASEIQEKGLKVGEMTNLLLQKIEELTLYLIDQNKIIKEQAKKIEELESKMNK